MKTLRIFFDIPTPAPGAGYRVRHRIKGSADAFTVTDLPAGTTSPIEIAGIPDNQDIEGTIQGNCDGVDFSTEISFNALRTEWVVGTTTCEQANVFTLSSQIDGLSSPSSIMYDAVTDKVYGVDADEANGGFFHYPASATTKSQFTFIPLDIILPPTAPAAQRYIYNSAVDKTYRRLYAVGKDTGGLQVYDIAANTVSKIPYGLNHNAGNGATGTGNGFNRLGLVVTDDYVICTDVYSNEILILNRADLSVNRQTTIENVNIPSSTSCLKGSPIIIQVGVELWVLANNVNSADAGGTTAHIYRYDNTLTTLLGTIDLTADSVRWANNSYWRNAHVDVTNNLFYVVDFGSKKMIVVNTTTNTVDATRTKAFEITGDKSGMAARFIENPITGDLMLSAGFVDDPGDTGSSKCTYRINRTTSVVERSYAATQFLSLERIGSTALLHAAAPGNTAWVGGSWSTDGIIYKYTA